jgi:hypothetical protein
MPKERSGEGGPKLKLVSTPYRWLWPTFWKNISHWGWDIRNGIRNIPIFFSAVWWFREWDWTGTVELLRVSAKRMLIAQEIGRHQGSEREAQRLRVVVALCDRLLADKYFAVAGHDRMTWKSLSDFERTKICKHASYMKSQDAAYLGKMLRFIQHWWE